MSKPIEVQPLLDELIKRLREFLTTLHAKNGQPDWNKVAKLVAEWQPMTFVVGNPCDKNAPASAPSSPQFSDKLLKFREQLQTQFKLPVESADESYTSTEARHLLKEQRRAGRPGKIIKDKIDMTAAAVILQSWLSQTQKNRHEQTH